MTHHAPNHPSPEIPNRFDVARTSEQILRVSGRIIDMALTGPLDADSGVHADRGNSSTTLQLPSMTPDNPNIRPYIHLKDEEAYHPDGHHGGHSGKKHGHGHHEITTQSVWMTDGKLGFGQDQYGDPTGDKKDNQVIVEAGSMIALNDHDARTKFGFAGYEVHDRDKNREVKVRNDEKAAPASMSQELKKMQVVDPKLKKGIRPSIPTNLSVSEKADYKKHMAKVRLRTELRDTRHEAAKILWHGYKETRKARKAA